MGPTIFWNPGAVPSEVESSLTRVLFLRGRRLFTLGLGCAATGLTWASWKLSRDTPAELIGILLTPFWGTVAGVLFLEALTSFWTQKGLVVDLGRREIALVGRHLRGGSRQVYAFASLRSVRVDSTGGTATQVFLIVREGTPLLLGRDRNQAARAFAARIAGLTGLPCEG